VDIDIPPDKEWRLFQNFSFGTAFLVTSTIQYKGNSGLHAEYTTYRGAGGKTMLHALFCPQQDPKNLL
jgi:hypothetical protein